jgi:hypothetical protein
MDASHHSAEKISPWKVFYFIYFLWYWSLNSGPTTWATPPVFFCEGFFRDRSHEPFAWAGFEPWSSWSLPPE